MHIEKFNPSALIGAIRRFGELGPAYQVMGVVKNGSLEDTILSIRVLESAEDAEYPATQAIQDPQA